MKNIAISTEHVDGALRVTSDAFVSIGDGLEILLPKDAKVGDTWIIRLEPFKTIQPLVSALQSEELFVSSRIEQLASIRHNLVVSQLNTSDVVNLPERSPTTTKQCQTNMLVSYFNHLFAVRGRRLFWSDLDNPWEWEPHPHNEADSRLVEWESDDCTGLIRTADKLWMHFPRAIYEVNYVGKPTIVTIRGSVDGIGSVSPRCLVKHNTVQFFLGLDNFYVYSTEMGLHPIGHSIWRKFVQQRDTLENTWAYVDHRNNEICWVSGQYIWAFNFLEKTWFKHSTDNLTAHTTTFWSDAQPISETTPSTIDSDKFDGVENLWVTENDVCREARAGDWLDQCVLGSAPFLESDEQHYGDLHFVKRCDLVVLDARYTWPWSGVLVQMCAKDYVTQESSFEDAAVWTQTDPSRQSDFRTRAGKVLQFRFEMQMNWLSDGHPFDGTHLLDGVLDNGAEVAPFGRFELNAWGERVDLPQTLVGPDK